jgi:hypothetical protein
MPREKWGTIVEGENWTGLAFVRQIRKKHTNNFGFRFPKNDQIPAPV